MATEVVMPQMGYDMTEGTVVRWIKHEGDAVAKGEVIAEIEKATIEMEADAGGVLRRVAVQEGATVPVGQIIGLIGTADEVLPGLDAAPASIPAAAAQATTATPTPPSSTPAPADASGDPLRQPSGHASTQLSTGLRASPVARRIADEQGIDLSQVTGTGPDGRITKDDVQNAAKQAAAPAAPAAATPTPVLAQTGRSLRTGLAPVRPDTQGRIPLSKMGQAIARRTAATKGPVPHYYVNVGVDMTRAIELRRDLNEALGGQGRVSINDVVVKASAVALAKYPVFNSTFEGDHLQVSPHINIGIAVALDDGLIAPAVLECERKTLVEIARETKDLGQRARSGKLRQNEYTAATFSISNLGMFNVDAFTAIIVSPQVAVLAVGAVKPTPVVQSGEVVVRQVMQATLSADHRVSNGADAAQFLVEIKRLLENPLVLVAEGLRVSKG